MTIGEIQRLIKSQNRKKKNQDKEKAAFDYIQAQLIIRGVSSAIVGGEGIPELTEAYGSLFEDTELQKAEEKQNVKDELSALRFKQFAQFHNKKYEEVLTDNE